jgi:hypothetical protein
MMMSDPIVIKFTLSRAELVRAIRLLMLRQKVLWLLIPVGLAWIGSPFISYYAEWLNGQKAVFQPQGLVYTVIGIAFFVFLFGVVPGWSVRKMNPAIRDNPQEFRFTETEVDSINGVAQGKLDWKLWVRFGETKEFFLLYPNTQAANILPKRAFASTAEQDAFRELVARKLKRT